MNNNYLINDYRKVSSFSKTSFSGYPKKDIIKSFINNLILSKVHDACYLGIEMHISLYFNLIIENVFLISSQYVNISNPNLPNILYTELLRINKIKSYNKIKDDRNDQEIRNLISYIISVVTLSPKNSNFQIDLLTKINDMNFDVFVIEKNIKYKNLDLVMKLFFPDESKELILVINEIANILRNPSGKTKEILYWFSWLIDWEKKCRRDGNELIIKSRKIDGVTPKNSKFWEWIVWSVFINEAYYRDNPNIYKQIYSLYNIYKFNFKKSSRRKYMIYLLHSLFIFKKKINWNENPLSDKQKYIIQANFTNNMTYKLIFNGTQQKFYLEDEPEPVKQPSKTHIHIKPKKETQKEIDENEIKKRMSYLYI